MPAFADLRVAVFASDGFDASELVESVRILKSAGTEVDILSLSTGEIQGLHRGKVGQRVKVDRHLDDAPPAEYNALLIPGGALSVDRLRAEAKVQSFVRAMQSAWKPIATLRHGPWILISSGLVQGRTLTSSPSIRDDIRNAGGNWQDRPIVLDNNWITARDGEDLEGFSREALGLFTRRAPTIIREPKLALA